MNNAKPIVARIASITLAIGLVMASNFFTPIQAAEVAAPATTPAVTQTTPATKTEVPWVDNRVLAVGLGALGGVVAFSLFTRGWGMGAVRMARFGVPAGAAAARFGGGFAGRWILAAAVGLGGALVGDFIYRSNHTGE